MEVKGREPAGIPGHVAILFIAVIMLSGGYFLTTLTANPTSRLAAIFSFVEPGTGVTGTLELARPFTEATADSQGKLRPPATIDWARNPEHGYAKYSNKAPGSYLYGIPVYGVLYIVERIAGLQPLEPKLTYINMYLLNLLMTVLPSAIMAFYLARMAIKLTGIHWSGALAFSLLTWHGSLLWVYSTNVWGHVPAAAAVTFAIWNLLKIPVGQPEVAKQPEVENPPSIWPALWCGFWAGYSVLAEYSCAFVVAGLGVVFLYRRNWRLLVFFIVGGIGPLIAHLVYHGYCFGAPLSTANAFNNPVFRQEGAAFSLPKPGIILELLFLPYRGLFQYSPLLILALFVFRKKCWRTRPALVWLCLGVFGAFLLMNASFVK